MLKIPFKKSSFFADKTLSVVGISIGQRAIPKNITLFLPYVLATAHLIIHPSIRTMHSFPLRKDFLAFIKD